jgi:hypothetical protein
MNNTKQDYMEKVESIERVISDIRSQMRANDYNVKMIHPERNTPLGHSQEIGLTHIEDKLRAIESILDLEVNKDYSLILSDRNADFSQKEEK